MQNTQSVTFYLNVQSAFPLPSLDKKLSDDFIKKGIELALEQNITSVVNNPVCPIALEIDTEVFNWDDYKDVMLHNPTNAPDNFYTCKVELPLKEYASDKYKVIRQYGGLFQQADFWIETEDDVNFLNVSLGQTKQTGGDNENVYAYIYSNLNSIAYRENFTMEAIAAMYSDGNDAIQDKISNMLDDCDTETRDEFRKALINNLFDEMIAGVDRDRFPATV